MPNKYPILLLTGYLGAGKTTLLNHLLALPAYRNRRLALIINEFGTLGVDGQLVRPGAWARFELNKGSLFCICVKTDFIRTLDIIARRVRPELVLVEATGIAETRDLEAFVDEPHLADQFEIAANVCVVDALNFTKVAPMLKAARGQVEWADALVVNKVDLVEPGDLEPLRRVLTSMNPRAPIAEVSHGAISAEFLAGLRHEKRRGELLAQPPDPLFSASFETQRPVRRDAFLAALEQLRDHVLRLKGRVDFGAGPLFVEVVNGRYMEKPIESAGPPPAGSAFVVVAWKVRQAHLEEVFQSTWA